MAVQLRSRFLLFIDRNAPPENPLLPEEVWVHFHVQNQRFQQYGNTDFANLLSYLHSYIVLEAFLLLLLLQDLLNILLFVCNGLRFVLLALLFGFVVVPNFFTQLLQKRVVNLHSILLAFVQTVDVVGPILDFVVDRANNNPVERLDAESRMYHDEVAQVEQDTTRKRSDHTAKVFVVRATLTERVEVHEIESSGGLVAFEYAPPLREALLQPLHQIEVELVEELLRLGLQVTVVGEHGPVGCVNADLLNDVGVDGGKVTIVGPLQRRLILLVDLVHSLAKLLALFKFDFHKAKFITQQITSVAASLFRLGLAF